MSASAPPNLFARRFLGRLVCRILGHRWRFLHAREGAGKVYRCQRCGIKAVFVR